MRKSKILLIKIRIKLKEKLNILRKDYYDLLYEYSNSKVEAKATKMGMTSIEFVESQRYFYFL